MSTVTDEELKRLLTEAAAPGEDGRRWLSCEQAFAVKAEHGVPLSRIGACCDDENIRITSCQLGCFKRR